MTDRGALYWHKIDLSTSTQLPEFRIISLTQGTVWLYETKSNVKIWIKDYNICLKTTWHDIVIERKYAAVLVSYA